MCKKIAGNALFAFALMLALAVSFSAEAATIPQRVSVQGILKNASGTPVDGTVSIEFLFYDAATGGTALWQDTLSVNVSKGRYGVILGSTANPLTVTVFQTLTWLAMNVNADGEMTPRVKVTTAPYAFAAEQANSANTASDALTLGGLLDSAFALLAGRPIGQTLYGGTGAGENLVLRSTADVTKGNVILADDGGLVGIGTSAPGSPLTVAGIVESTTGGFKFPDATLQTTAAAAPLNLPPVALLTVSREVLGTDYFDASTSYDPEGGALVFAWDLEGDGTFTAFGPTSTVSQAYRVSPVLAAMRVRDVAGQIAESKAFIGATWAYTIVDNTNVGTQSSLAVVNGRPMIAYYDSPNSDLKFAIGSGTWTITTVDSTGNVGNYPSLAEVAGRPAISYQDSTNGALKFAINTLADGSGAWTIQTVVGGGGQGIYTSLAVVDGRPAISYYDQANGDLKFALNALADGSGAWTLTTVDGTGPGDSVGQYSSLAVVAGRPAISYLDGTTGVFDLKFAINALTDGSGAWTITTVDSVGDVGPFTSLAVVAGRPAISYHDDTNSDLKFAINALADGSGAWAFTTVDSMGAVGQDTSLAVVDGRPAISYHDNANFDLKFAINALADGSGAWKISTLDSVGDVGRYTSLADVAGRPAIAYYDTTNTDLKFVILP